MSKRTGVSLQPWVKVMMCEECGCCRSLRETKDGVCAERDRILSRHKELEEKHEKLVTE